MSLLISGDLRLAKGYDGFTDDADATAYLAAVQAADGQVLEPAVRLAVNMLLSRAARLMASGQRNQSKLHFGWCEDAERGIGSAGWDCPYERQFRFW
jgi:hypothetical protein